MPVAWVLGFPMGFGAPGVWLGFAMGVTLAAIVLPLRFWRLTR